MTYTDRATATPTRTAPAPSLLDPALLLARIALGAVMVLHGWQKFFTNGIDGTTSFFTASGVPLPGVAAVGVATLELVGGVLLIAGLATRVIAGLNALSMIGAIVFVHGSAGFFAADGGYEFVLLLALFSVVLALTGPGRWSLDAAITGRRRS